MIAATQGFVQKLRRDDLALEHVAGHLISALAGDIRESGIDDGNEDFNRLSAMERSRASARAVELRDAIRAARNRTVNEKSKAIEGLRSQFGDRIPYRLDWVEIDGQAEDVRSTPAIIVPSPRVDSTKAG